MFTHRKTMPKQIPIAYTPKWSDPEKEEKDLNKQEGGEEKQEEED